MQMRACTVYNIGGCMHGVGGALHIYTHTCTHAHIRTIYHLEIFLHVIICMNVLLYLRI